MSTDNVNNIARKPRYLRLLPSVMLVCGGLLMLKTSGLVHDALAAEPAAHESTEAPQSARPDLAGDDNPMSSAAEVDVLTSLAKRRTSLDAREAQLQIQANMLAATESRVDAKIGQLKTLQTQIAALLTQRDAEQEKQVDALVKTYSAMKSKDAARIFDNLDEGVLLPVAQKMKSDVMAPILAAMAPQNAQKLTVKLASKLALPDTTAAAPVAAAAPATPAAPAQASQAQPAPAAEAAKPKA